MSKKTATSPYTFNVNGVKLIDTGNGTFDFKAWNQTEKLIVTGRTTADGNTLVTFASLTGDATPSSMVATYDSAGRLVDFDGSLNSTANPISYDAGWWYLG